MQKKRSEFSAILSQQNTATALKLHLHVNCKLPHLYSAVTPVSYNDVSIGIHSHASGSVELAVPFAMRAELEQELPISAVHLRQKARKVRSASSCARPPFKIKITAKVANSDIGRLFFLPSQSDCENRSR